jgi:catechol 2,3-dioxygenase-like lactoylglutathione lyase family enzyme
MAGPVFTGINHICITTRDIDRAVRIWADRYGVGPWRLYTFDPSTMSVSVDGEAIEFGMRVALCQFGPATRVEIIQPLDDDRSPYAKSLNAHDGADHVHHIRLDVDNYEGSLEQLDGLGIQRSLSGRYGGEDPGIRSWATYLATEADLGFTAEVAYMPPGWTMAEPDYVYP